MFCEEGEPLDPRIQVELEKLNTATEEINKSETSLEEANSTFRTMLTESTSNLNLMAKKIGGAVEKARPYYEAKESAVKAQLECQKAAVQYQRASALHETAKKTITLAEDRFVFGRRENIQFDNTWQDMLNSATVKVMEAEVQKYASEREHRFRAQAFARDEERVTELSQGLRSAINKSIVYFEQKAKLHRELEDQKQKILLLQEAVQATKSSYAQSLRNLEKISEEIHEHRRCRLPREPGVGAEQEPIVRDEESAVVIWHLDRRSVSEEQYWGDLQQSLRHMNFSSCDYNKGDESANDTLSANTRSDSRRWKDLTPEESFLERVVTGEAVPESCSADSKSVVQRTESTLDSVTSHEINS